MYVKYSSRACACYYWRTRLLSCYMYLALLVVTGAQDYSPATQSWLVYTYHRYLAPTPNKNDDATPSKRYDIY